MGQLHGQERVELRLRSPRARTSQPDFWHLEKKKVSVKISHMLNYIPHHPALEKSVKYSEDCSQSKTHISCFRRKKNPLSSLGLFPLANPVE